jgi:hypothetical protein
MAEMRSSPDVSLGNAADDISDNRVATTTNELERFFSAATATAADLLRLVKMITVPGIPSDAGRNAILAIWKRLFDEQAELVERFHCEFGGKRICDHFRSLRKFQVTMGRFQGPSHSEVLQRAAKHLLESLWRRTNVDEWQRGSAWAAPNTAAVSSLVESWRSVQAEVRVQFKRFPRAYSRIVNKVLQEMILVEGLCSTEERPQAKNEARTERRAHLTRGERNIIEVLKHADRRLTTDEIQSALAMEYHSDSLSTTKLILAAMVEHGLLDNCKTKPRGYGLLIDPSQPRWNIQLHRE